MIQGLDHVGIAVHSIEESKRFYEELGLEIEAIEEVASEGVRVAIIPCGSVRIELLEPLSDDSAVGRFLAKRGQGIHHLCLSTGDVFEASDRLRDSGLRVLKEQPTPGAEGCMVQFVHPASAGGVLYELSQRPEGGGHGHGSED